jgi:hypothetical protein
MHEQTKGAQLPEIFFPAKTSNIMFSNPTNLVYIKSIRGADICFGKTQRRNGGLFSGCHQPVDDQSLAIKKDKATIICGFYEN